MIEADLTQKVRKEVEARGVRFDVVNPWNFNHGAFEGCYIDPADGTRYACSDPRRAGQAEGVYKKGQVPFFLQSQQNEKNGPVPLDPKIKTDINRR